MRTHDIEVDGIRLQYAEAGDGPALVFLHGLSATHANWEFTLPAFADRWRVIAPDLPGHGGSAKPDAPYTIDFYAGVVRSLGRELGVREAVVVGNSLGGQIALELAIAYPVWTRAVVLVAPAGGWGLPVQTMRWLVARAARPGLLRVALPWALDRCVYDRSTAVCAERRRILAERLAHDDYPSFARAVARSLHGSMAATQPIERVNQPTLLVWGREDRLVALAQSKRLARAMPHARLAVLDRCGHLPQVERPVEFNRILADFLRAVEAAPLRGARGAA